MLRHLSKNNFIEMPWKNGQGTTLELFRLPAENEASFWFRISMADIKSNGPFSIFPFIDRSLFLVYGKGMILELSGKEITLVEKWKAFHFSGDEPVICRLIEGSCQDFNVMVDRRYGKVIISNLSTSDHQFQCTCDFKFIYDTEGKTLTVLEKDDHYHFLSSLTSHLVICDLTKLV